MLTGGSGDSNLEAFPGDEEGLDDSISRVRTLLKFGVMNKGKQVTAQGKEREDIMVERWKAIFSKYDRDGSGILRLCDVSRMVRLDLKISERLISDKQLEQVFQSMDEDGGGAIEFSEFMSFVQQKAKKNYKEEDVVATVGRAVRLALIRNKILIKDLEDKFRNYDDLDPATGELGPQEMRRFFRKVLDVSKHECSDRNLKIAFSSMDDDGSGSMSTEEFLDFIKFCFRGMPSKEVPRRLQGLVAGSRDVVQNRLPRHRPGTEPGMPLTGVPFCLSGRDLRVTHRLGSEIMRGTFDLAKSGKQEHAEQASEGDVGDERDSNATRSSFHLVPTISGSIPSPMSPHGGAGLPPLIARSNSAPVLSPVGLRDRFDLNTPKRTWTVPKKPLGDYKTLKGAQALNRIEQHLFEVGVDARGMYHSLR